MSEEATNSEIPEEETSLPESAEQSETQESVDTPEVESEEAEKPRKPTAKDRIDELTRLRREAERDAEYWKGKALQAPEPRQEPSPQPQAIARPDPLKYDAGEFDSQYIEDLADWKANEVVERKLAERDAQSSMRESESEWNRRVTKASETMPDFEEKVILGARRNEWDCSPGMGEALRASESGPELAYHLASNPVEAARISRLSPALQLMELGKLEAKLAQPKPKTVTNAPEPPPQGRGSGGKFQVNPDTNDFAAFEQTYGNG